MSVQSFVPAILFDLDGNPADILDFIEDLALD